MKTEEMIMSILSLISDNKNEDKNKQIIVLVNDVRYLISNISIKDDVILFDTEKLNA